MFPFVSFHRFVLSVQNSSCAFSFNFNNLNIFLSLCPPLCLLCFSQILPMLSSVFSLALLSLFFFYFSSSLCFPPISISFYSHLFPSLFFPLQIPDKTHHTVPPLLFFTLALTSILLPLHLPAYNSLPVQVYLLPRFPLSLHNMLGRSWICLAVLWGI